MTKSSSALAVLKQTGRRLQQGLEDYGRHFLSGKLITSFWGYGNFGDLITPFLLSKLGYTPLNTARVSLCEVAFVGSILDPILNGYRGVILGSGFLNDQHPKALRRATVLALRGELSKRLCGVSAEIPLGDGGLLLPHFIPDRPEKTHLLGIVPHYSDANDGRIGAWKTSLGPNVDFIDVKRDPAAVFRDVGRCEYLASSSLHGLVVADSLGIPSLWLELSDLSGNGDFKFHDYYSGLGVTRRSYCPTGREDAADLVSRTSPPPAAVAERTEQLLKAFSSLPDVIGEKRSRRTDRFLACRNSDGVD